MATQDVDRELRNRLISLVSGDMDLEAFDTWFSPLLMELASTPEDPAGDLACAVGLQLAELTNGDWTVEELRDHFRELLETQFVRVSSGDHVVSAGASATLVDLRVDLRAPEHAGR